MYTSIANDIEGITLPTAREPLFDFTASAGSAGRLQGAIHFPVKWGLAGGPSLHELMHRWANFSLDFGTLKDVGSKAEDPMLGASSGAHWGISSVNGQLGGFDLSTFKELGGGVYQADPFGTFANGGNRLPYSDLELYLAGFIDASEVADIVSFTGLSASNAEFYESGQWKAESKLVTTISDIIAEIGERKPSYETSQKAFRALVLVLSDEPLSDEDWTLYSEQAIKLEKTFSWATGGRATLNLGGL